MAPHEDSLNVQVNARRLHKVLPGDEGAQGDCDAALPLWCKVELPTFIRRIDANTHSYAAHVRELQRQDEDARRRAQPVRVAYHEKVRLSRDSIRALS